MLRSLLIHLVVPWVAGLLAFAVLIKLIEVAGFRSVVNLWLFGWLIFFVACRVRHADPSPIRLEPLSESSHSATELSPTSGA